MPFGIPSDETDDKLKTIKATLIYESKAIKTMTKLLKGTVENLMDETVKCKELQNIIMDLESIDGHCNTLIEVGPSNPYIEVQDLAHEEETPSGILPSESLAEREGL